MYSFYYETRGFRAHDGAEPPESWLSHPASSSPCTSHPRHRPLGPAPCMFQNGLLFLRNLGCVLIPLFWGLAGLRDRGTGTLGVKYLSGFIQTLSDAIYRRPHRCRPIALIKQCSFSSCDLMLLVRTLDRHWFMFLSSYKCSDLQAGNIADCT